MKTCLTLLCAFSLAGCASVPPDECEQSLEFPLELTAYIQGIGGIIDADMLPSICLDK